jgi:hypothetical protein
MRGGASTFTGEVNVGDPIFRLMKPKFAKDVW